MWMIHVLILAFAILTVVSSDDGIILPWRNQTKESRIIGGSTAPNNRYPYTVPIYYNGQFTCGGTLITKDTILTAAHCLDGKDNTDDITVLIGSDNVNDGDIMTVRKVVQHPDYEQMSDDDYSYDVGLIFLSQKVQNNIQLPKLNDGSTVPLVGSTTYALGWGITDTTTSSLPNDLQIVDLAVISNSDCSLEYPGDINSDMLCTFNEGKDACQGDSGGPLIIRGNSPSLDNVVGVVSWGEGCATSKPGVFSRVSMTYEWIKTNVCQDSNDATASLCTPPPTPSPTRNPTNNPTPQPSSPPSPQPSSHPTIETETPTSSPTYVPSYVPTNIPTFQPSPIETPAPPPSLTSLQGAGTASSLSAVPSNQPSESSEPLISIQPTSTTNMPTAIPTTYVPTLIPTLLPTVSMSNPTLLPTTSSMPSTSSSPSVVTYTPTYSPTTVPTMIPTISNMPSVSSSPSTMMPTYLPTVNPTVTSDNPTYSPTLSPSLSPTLSPSLSPTISPTLSPTLEPTLSPTLEPTLEPTLAPTALPTSTPTLDPTLLPTITPSAIPTSTPTLDPTEVPTVVPTATPTEIPSTLFPTLSPSFRPTLSPTVTLTEAPTGDRLPTASIPVPRPVVDEEEDTYDGYDWGADGWGSGWNGSWQWNGWGWQWYNGKPQPPYPRPTQRPVNMWGGSTSSSKPSRNDQYNGYDWGGTSSKPSVDDLYYDWGGGQSITMYDWGKVPPPRKPTTSSDNSDDYNWGGGGSSSKSSKGSHYNWSGSSNSHNKPEVPPWGSVLLGSNPPPKDSNDQDYNWSGTPSSHQDLEYDWAGGTSIPSKPIFWWSKSSKGKSSKSIQHQTHSWHSSKSSKVSKSNSSTWLFYSNKSGKKSSGKASKARNRNNRYPWEYNSLLTKEEGHAIVQSSDQGRNNAGRGVRIRKECYLFSLLVILVGLL